MSAEDAYERRAQMADGWERASVAWARQADRIRQFGMPVSVWMVDRLQLHPGQRVLELAAGPGDTGFLAAELIQPGGTLVCSDGSEGMLELARQRAAAQGITNVEFAHLNLEWIDLPAAGVDAILCRWGVMLCLDPDAALRECRRVLRPGGRLVLAVWDTPASNPWATVPLEALVTLGHLPAPPPGAPGMFALAAPGELARRLSDAGFVEPVVAAVAVSRAYPSVGDWLTESLDCSSILSEAWQRLSGKQRLDLTQEVATRAAAFVGTDGSIVLPGSSLAAVADA